KFGPGYPDRSLQAVLLTVSLPFIWIGVSLTVRRLRTVGWPLWLTFLIFIPFLKLILFALLCLTSRSHDQPSEGGPTASRLRRFGNLIPTGKFGAAMLGIALSALVGLIFGTLSTN